MEKLLNDIFQWLTEITPPPEGAKPRFEFTNLPHSWWTIATIFIILLLVITILSIYRKEGKKMSTLKRLFLATIRCMVILIAFVIIFNPTIAYDRERTIDSYVIILLDDSLSMALGDTYAGEKKLKQLGEVTGKEYGKQTQEVSLLRIALLNKVLSNKKFELIERLREKNKVKLVVFSSSSKTANVLSKKTEEGSAEKYEKFEWEAIKPKGLTTNIAGALRKSIDDLGGYPISAIIVISDGIANDGTSPSVAAEYAKSKGIPIFCYGIGIPRDPKNIRISEFLGNNVAFANDPLLFTVQLTHRGCKNKMVKLILKRRKKDEKKEEKVKEKDISLGPDNAVHEVTFKDKIKQKGEFVYRVYIEPLEKEISDKDNQKIKTVKITDSKAKVLIISGTATYEYRYLKNLLIREKNTKLSCWLQSADEKWPQEGDVRLDHMPIKFDEIKKYHTIILIDPDPIDFDIDWIENLKKFVENEGGGLLFIASETHTYDFFSKIELKEIVNLLPIEPDMTAADSLYGFRQTYSKEFPIEITKMGITHLTCSFVDDPQKTKNIWEALPGFYWFFPVKKAKPLARVLLQHADPTQINDEGERRILAATQFYGPGRTMFIAFDETFRWRTLYEDYFEQFWVQTVRYLMAGKVFGGKKRAEIFTSKEVYALGEEIIVRAKVKDKSYENPLTAKEVTAYYEFGEGRIKKIVLKPEKGKKGSYIGSFFPSQEGNIIIGLEGIPKEKVKRKNITVEIPNLEKDSPKMKKEILIDIANRSNGRYLELAEIKNLPMDIKDNKEKIIIPGRPRMLWSVPGTIILLCLLLTIEWFIRKRSNLA